MPGLSPKLLHFSSHITHGERILTPLTGEETGGQRGKGLALGRAVLCPGSTSSSGGWGSEHCGLQTHHNPLGVSELQIPGSTLEILTQKAWGGAQASVI